MSERLNHRVSSWTNVSGALIKLAVSKLNGDGQADLASITSTANIFYNTNLGPRINIPGRLYLLE